MITVKITQETANSTSNVKNYIGYALRELETVPDNHKSPGLVKALEILQKLHTDMSIQTDRYWRKRAKEREREAIKKKYKF